MNNKETGQMIGELVKTSWHPALTGALLGAGTGGLLSLLAGKKKKEDILLAALLGGGLGAGGGYLYNQYHGARPPAAGGPEPAPSEPVRLIQRPQDRPVVVEKRPAQPLPRVIAAAPAPMITVGDQKSRPRPGKHTGLAPRRMRRPGRGSAMPTLATTVPGMKKRTASKPADINQLQSQLRQMAFGAADNARSHFARRAARRRGSVEAAREAAIEAGRQSVLESDREEQVDDQPRRSSITDYRRAKLLGF